MKTDHASCNAIAWHKFGCCKYACWGRAKAAHELVMSDEQYLLICVNMILWIFSGATLEFNFKIRLCCSGYFCYIYLCHTTTTFSWWGRIMLSAWHPLVIKHAPLLKQILMFYIYFGAIVSSILFFFQIIKNWKLFKTSLSMHLLNASKGKVYLTNVECCRCCW